MSYQLTKTASQVLLTLGDGRQYEFSYAGFGVYRDTPGSDRVTIADTELRRTVVLNNVLISDLVDAGATPYTAASLQSFQDSLVSGAGPIIFSAEFSNVTTTELFASDGFEIYYDGSSQALKINNISGDKIATGSWCMRSTTVVRFGHYNETAGDSYFTWNGVFDGNYAMDYMYSSVLHFWAGNSSGAIKGELFTKGTNICAVITQLP